MTSWLNVLLWYSSIMVLQILKAMLDSDPGSSWKLRMSWLAVWGTCWRGKQSSGLDPAPKPQSPYFPAARSTSFALLVWLGMNGTGLVFFQTGFTLPHYKPPCTVLSPALSPRLLQGQCWNVRGVLFWELFWAERTGKSDPLSCLVFQTASACGEGIYWECVRENTEKGKKAQKGRRKKVQQGS